MGQLWNRPTGTALVAVAVALLAGCESSLKPGLTYNLEDYISSVTDVSGTVQGTLIAGDAPAAGDGPSASVNGIGVMINGGSSQQSLTGDASFTRVIVAGAGMTNYYQLDLPSGVASQGILLGGSSNAVAGKIIVQYAVGDGSTIGAYANQDVRFLRVGTGDIQISVAWDDTSDVDLHVFDPNGDHIFYGNKTVTSGGVLDLDGNAACVKNPLPGGGTGYVSNENVVWPTGRAIAGQYKVVLNYYSPCGSASTDYVVTLQRVGASPEVFTGTFVGSGAAADTVTVFTY